MDEAWESPDVSLGAFEQLSSAPRSPVQVARLPEQLAARLDAAAAQCLGEGVKASLLWQEVALLERLRGKHKSPHRQTRMYARLCEVCRTLRLLRQLQLHNSCVELFAQPSRRAAGASQVASRAHGVQVCRRLLAGARLCASARKQLLCAAAECNVLLAATFFMPVALVLLSSLARVAVLLRSLLVSCSDAYNVLLPLLSSLPLGKGHGWAGQDGDGESGVVCLPELLRCDWGTAEDAITPVGVHLVRLTDDAAPCVDTSPMVPLTVLESRSPAGGLDVASPAYVRIPLLLDAPQLQAGNTPAASPLNWLLGGTEMDQT